MKIQKIFKIFLLLVLIGTMTKAQTFQTVVEVQEQCGQLSFMSNQEAEIAVDLILEQFSLTRTFVIQECPDIKNAIAKIVQVSPNYKERYIFYDPDFLDQADGSAKSKWGAYFILAHEIAHHLNGDSLDGMGSLPSYEIKADFFAGTALGLLGASLDEAQRAIETLITYEKATATHPAKSDRLDAIKRGWNIAKKGKNRSSKQEITRQVVNVKAGNNIEVFDLNKKKAEEFHRKAIASYDKKNFLVAAENELKAYQFSGQNLEYLAWAATFYIADNKYDIGFEYLLIIIKKNYKGLAENSINTVNEQIGLLYFDKGQIDDAIRFFEIIKTQRNNDVNVYNNLASAYIKKGDGNKALEYALIAAKLRPKKVYAKYDLGTSFFNLGQDKEAIKFLRQAIDAGKDDLKNYSTVHNAYLNLSLVYWNIANKTITEINALNNTTESQSKYKTLKAKMDDNFQKSIAVLEEGVRTYPNAQGLRTRLNKFKAAVPK